MLQLTCLTVTTPRDRTYYKLLTLKREVVFFYCINGPHINIMRQTYSPRSNNEIFIVLYVKIFERIQDTIKTVT